MILSGYSLRTNFYNILLPLLLLSVCNFTSTVAFFAFFPAWSWHTSFSTSGRLIQAEVQVFPFPSFSYLQQQHLDQDFLTVVLLRVLRCYFCLAFTFVTDIFHLFAVLTLCNIQRHYHVGVLVVGFDIFTYFLCSVMFIKVFCIFSFG